MSQNQFAKEAALEKIKRTCESLYINCSSSQYIVNIGNNLKTIEDNINKYDLDRTIYKEAIENAFKILMERGFHSDAENFAIKYMNNEEKTHEKSQLSNDISTENNNLSNDITWAIFITIGFSIFYFFLLKSLFNFNLIKSLLFSILFAILHPYIGRFFYGIAKIYAKSIDKYFNLKANKSWYKNLENNALIFSAFWPLTGLPYIIIGILGSTFGSIYKSLFQK